MIQISPDALRQGCERAEDLFLLNRLRTRDDAASGYEAVYRGLGLDLDMRRRLERCLLELVPVRGIPEIESLSSVSMLAGVLVGLLIADSAIPGKELDLPGAPNP
jgi:hypothetical protein